MSKHEPKLEIVHQMDGDYAVFDANAPQTEHYYYGLVCNGCSTREDAERFIAEYQAEQKRREELKRIRPIFYD
jgi:hypothetical protein